MRLPLVENHHTKLSRRAEVGPLGPKMLISPCGWAPTTNFLWYYPSSATQNNQTSSPDLFY